jgi:twinkle protein
MEAAVVRHGCRVIVIDPFNELDSSAAKGESETNYIGRFIRTMKRFARKFQVHVIVVAHPAKLLRIDGQYPRPTLYDINGSSHWYNKAEIGIIVHRKDDSTVIWVQKSRYHETIGRPGEVEMAYVGDDRRYRELSRIS